MTLAQATEHLPPLAVLVPAHTMERRTLSMALYIHGETVTASI
jgi:hypothetical protein